MAGRVVSIELTWDFPVPIALESSQRWVLSAMRDYGPGLITMLWRILGNEQDVCDAYQDTFLKLAHNEQRSKPENVRAYVFRSASNAAISILRRRLSDKARLASVHPAGAGTSSSAGELDSQFLKEALRGDRPASGKPARRCNAARPGELSYEQVAKILQITAASARVYRCKAVQLLAGWMRKETAQ